MAVDAAGKAAQPPSLLPGPPGPSVRHSKFDNILSCQLFPRPDGRLKDYFKILEVHQDASVEVIDRAYKTLARKYHPDGFPVERRQWATMKMQELNEARSVLTSPARASVRMIVGRYFSGMS